MHSRYFLEISIISNSNYTIHNHCTTSNTQFTRQQKNSKDFRIQKVFGFKSIRMQSFHFRFRIQDLRTRDKLETFHSGLILLCVNGKMNPVPKRSGVVTNHANAFALVYILITS